MKRLVSISVLVIILVNLLGFQISLEHCCSDKFVIQFGSDVECFDGCCADEIDGDCCDLEYIQKDVGLQLFAPTKVFDFTSIPVSRFITIKEAVQAVHSNSIEYTAEFDDPPGYIRFCSYRC